MKEKHTLSDNEKVILLYALALATLAVGALKWEFLPGAEDYIDLGIIAVIGWYSMSATFAGVNIAGNEFRKNANRIHEDVQKIIDQDRSNKVQ